MLPYTAEVYLRLVGRYQQALEPLPLLAIAAALAAVLAAWRPFPGSDRLIGGLLALGWLGIGAGFHLQWLAPLHFLAPGYATAFTLQAVLLAWHALVRGHLPFRACADIRGLAGTLLALTGILAWPALDALAGAGWPTARVVLLMPGPTVVATLGLLLLKPGRPPWHLLAIPLLWVLVGGATAWRLGMPQDALLPVTALVALAAAARPRT